MGKTKTAAPAKTQVLAVGFDGDNRYELRAFKTRTGSTEYSVVNPDGNLLWVCIRTDSKAEAISLLRELVSGAPTGAPASQVS